MIEEMFAKANEMVSEEIPVTDCIMTRDEINSIMPPERTNMDLLPISVKQLRVIKIGDNIDLCPCAGTHVRNLSEIGELQFLGTKNKKDNSCKIYFRRLW